MQEISEYNSISETDDRREIIKQKLRQYYDGRIVRKDLTKSIREGANVPVYVLEYLLGQYCNSDDPEIIDEGVDNVKRILRDNYVRPDEAQKILSLLRERGSYKPPISSLAVLGEISIGGTLIKVEDLASTLQVCLDSGAKKVLLPITSAADLGTVPSDLVGAFSLIFYSSPEEAVYKALGVE